MGENEGIKICKEVVDILLSEKDLEERVDKVFTKIAHLGVLDVSFDYFKEVIKWCEKYRQYKKFELKLDGNFQAKEIELNEIANELKYLCTNIIKSNNGYI